MSYSPFNFRQLNADEVNKQYYAAQDWYRAYENFWEIPDWFVNYQWKGTPIETSKTDAETLRDENIVKIVLGEEPVDEWDNVIAKYRSIYGDKYIELATQQYNEYSK